MIYTNRPCEFAAISLEAVDELGKNIEFVSDFETPRNLADDETDVVNPISQHFIKAGSVL